MSRRRSVVVLGMYDAKEVKQNLAWAKDYKPLTAAERKALEKEVALTPPKPEELPKAIGPGRKWTVDDLISLTSKGLSGRSFEGGRRAYAAARCGVCATASRACLRALFGEAPLGHQKAEPPSKIETWSCTPSSLGCSRPETKELRAFVISWEGLVATGRVRVERALARWVVGPADVH